MENSSDKLNTEPGDTHHSLPPTQKYNSPGKSTKRHIVTTDISSILEEGTDNLHVDDGDEFFDHPLHSTAVEVELFDKDVSPHHAKSTQSQPVSPPKKQLEKRKNLENNKVNGYKANKSKKISEKLNENTVRKKARKTSTNVKASEPFPALKSVQRTLKAKHLPAVDANVQDKVVVVHTSGAKIQESKKMASPRLKSSSLAPVELSSKPTRGNQSRQSPSSFGTVLNQAEESVESSEQSEHLPRRKKRKTVLQSNDITSPNRNTVNNVSLKIWCPDGAKRSSRDISELDIVLDNFSNIITNYKHKVESDVCMKAVDNLFSSLKKPLTGSIEEVQKLKSIQKKNAKINAEINKKRKRLMAVNDELLLTEPQLKQLQKEYAQLEEKKSSLKIATQFLTDLEELQKEYMEYRKKYPKEKEEYGLSSLPALLLESRSILSAEKHLQSINSKLQTFLDKESEQGAQ